MKRIVLAIAALAVIFALTPAAAMAATPTASTGPAAFVSPTSEVVTGTANLGGNPTGTCTFEYGTSMSSLTSTQACAFPPAPGSSTATQVAATLTGLTPGTYYYALMESATPALLLGSATGTPESFTVPSATTPPAVANAAPSSVAGSTATVNGSVNANNWPVISCTFTYTASGGSAQTAPCGGSAEPSGTSAQAVSAALTNLVEGTTYSYSLSITYGSSTSPQTLTASSPGSFTTTNAAIGPAASITSTSATLQGSVNPEGQTVTACTFTYGPSFNSLSQAPCSVAPAAISGTTPTLVTAAVTGLTAKTAYIQTVVLTTAQGIAVAPLSSFTTTATLPAPTAMTTPATAVSATTATLNATVDAGGADVLGCEFLSGVQNLNTAAGTKAGVAHRCAATPSANGSQSVSVPLTHLTPGTVYYFQLYFFTDGGPVVSNIESFTTTRSGTATSAATPSVRIAKATLSARTRSARFSFTRSGAAAVTKGYECALAPVLRGKVGKLRYARCGASKTYTRLKTGKYAFSVRGANASGYGRATTYRFTL